jgi:hypothetical protein
VATTRDPGDVEKARCLKNVASRKRTAGRDRRVDRGRPAIEAFALHGATVIAAAVSPYDVPPEVIEFDVPPVTLDELCFAADAITLSSADWRGEAVGAGVDVPDVELVEVVEGVVVPELVAEVAADVVVPVVLGVVVVPAVDVVPVDEVPLVLVDVTADK